MVTFSVGCGDDSSDDGGGVNSGQIVVGPITEGMTKYYSLTTGEELNGADINTGKWDISFTRTRLIQTNSGDTAADLASGGKGGIRKFLASYSRRQLLPKQS
ncbi:MAG: HmuY family protein [Treponema sp.]|jgi:hypothetical protein|nr:HmuY family protein [Treponema sp.]